MISKGTETFPFNTNTMQQINNNAPYTQNTSSKYDIEQNKDGPYTSSKEGLGQRDNKDGTYTSSKEGIGQRDNKDGPYTSSKEGQAQGQN